MQTGMQGVFFKSSPSGCGLNLKNPAIDILFWSLLSFLILLHKKSVITRMVADFGLYANVEI